MSEHSKKKLNYTYEIKFVSIFLLSTELFTDFIINNKREKIAIGHIYNIKLTYQKIGKGKRKFMDKTN